MCNAIQGETNCFRLWNGKRWDNYNACREQSNINDTVKSNRNINNCISKQGLAKLNFRLFKTVVNAIQKDQAKHF